MINIAPSILSADFSKLAEEISLAEKGGAKYLHIDVMDGEFVPNISIGPVVISSIRPKSDMVFDVHLMIDRPERYIEDFAKAGADIITIHTEATNDISLCIDKIKACGKKAGLSIKPNTPVSAVFEYLDRIDLVLVMSVEPGFGGQGYLECADEKLRKLKETAPEGMLISVDGGVKLTNLAHVVKMGANTVVAGSAIFGQSDIVSTTEKFVKEANEAEVI